MRDLASCIADTSCRYDIDPRDFGVLTISHEISTANELYEVKRQLLLDMGKFKANP